jgi:hypothetical protein
MQHYFPLSKCADLKCGDRGKTWSSKRDKHIFVTECCSCNEQLRSRLDISAMQILLMVVLLMVQNVITPTAFASL